MSKKKAGPQASIDEVYLRILRTALGIKVRDGNSKAGHHPPQAIADELKKLDKRNEGPEGLKDVPPEIDAELKELGIKKQDVIAACNALMVPEGWTNAFGPILPLAKRLACDRKGRDRKSYAKRLRALALDLEREVLPVLADCRERFNLDLPRLEEIPTVLKNMARAHPTTLLRAISAQAI
jgi:hypothetical protein